MYRRDRGTRGGGVLVYVTENSVSRRRYDLEVANIAIVDRSKDEEEDTYL